MDVFETVVLVNWLAHLLLSEATPEYRIGNLLPDLVPASLLIEVPAEFRRGIKCHHQIDSYTDSHHIVARSIRRIGPTHRRYAGILVDVFYDHFLSCDWGAYSDVPLTEFIEEVHASFEEHCHGLPNEAVERLKQIRAGNWLSTYREIAPLQNTLFRLGQRFSRPVNLGEAIGDLELHYDSLHADFREFFPELSAHVGR